MSDDISKMLSNHNAESWSDVRGSDGDAIYDDPTVGPLERLDAYIEHCFDVYSVVHANLERSQLQTCIADWGHRRGQFRPNRSYSQREFGQRVSSTHERRDSTHAIFMATALIGVPPEDDKGCGWKQTVRHELGHAIDYEQRGTTDHSRHFKEVMDAFGDPINDGKSQHGYPPRWHR